MRRILAAVILAISIPLYAADQPRTSEQPKEKPLSNTDVISLVSAKFGNDVIIQKIAQAQTTAFDVSTDALIALKKKGVDDAVIKAMITRSEPPQKTEKTAPAATTTGQSEPTGQPESEGRLARLKDKVKSAVRRDSDSQAAATPNKKSPNDVKLYLTEKPTLKYKELGRVDSGKYNVAGISRSREAIDAELKKKAADIGADAVINITEDFASVSGVAIMFEQQTQK